MYDVIYVPLGDNEELKKRRQKLIEELVGQGWAQHGIVELRDSGNTLFSVQVLMKSIDEKH